ncbi:hypothetical protein JW826_01695 [Candidatus Woesearchaeota archaeon]|nr:hypothetical protein [Candidatus Woesearchaeota archaeon]
MAKVKRLHGRILVMCEKTPKFEQVFGIVSYSPAQEFSANWKMMTQETLSELKKHEKTTTFRVSAKRLTKDFSKTSPEIERELGALIVEATGWKVDLEAPELDVCLEIIGPSSYLFTKTIKCLGGLPVGAEGKVLVLISQDPKSHLAALLLAKRGCDIQPVMLESQKTPDVALLESFLPRQVTIEKLTGPDQMDIVAEKRFCTAIIVPDTLGTLQEYDSSYPILRPLIGLSDEEVLVELEKYKRAL